MRSRLATLCVTTLAPLLSACATTPSRFEPSDPAPPPAPIAIEASFERTWDAVIEYFAKAVISVETLDRVSGFIAATRAAIPHSTIAEHDAALDLARCGIWRGNIDDEIAPTTAKYNVLIRSMPDGRTSLLVTVRFLAVRYTRTYECESRRLFERGLEAAVKASAERPPP